jgi:hypothetical protein
MLRGRDTATGITATGNTATGTPLRPGAGYAGLVRRPAYRGEAGGEGRDREARERGGIGPPGEPCAAIAG